MRMIGYLAGMTTWTLCGCTPATPLFNGKDLAGWVEVANEGAWTVRDGILRCSGEKEPTAYAWLSTDRKYRDFELELDWRIEPGTNAGVFLRAPGHEGRISQLGFEVQLKDDREDKDLTDVTGAVFSRIPATGRYAKSVGEWNHSKITLKGRSLRIELNGHVVSDTPNMDELKPPDDPWTMVKVPDEGYIGLQNHGDPVEFRSIRIRELN